MANCGCASATAIEPVKNKECNHHIEATMLTEEEEEGKKTVKRCVCFVIEWNMMVMTDNIMSKEVWKRLQMR